MNSNENYAGVPFLVRFIGFLVDFLIVLIIFFLISGYTSAYRIGESIGYLSLGITAGGIISILISLVYVFVSILPHQVDQQIIYLIGFIIYYGYFLFFELTFKTTIGKLIFKMRLVSDETGNTPSFYQIFIRSLCRMIPFDPFSFISKTPHGWHDSIPKIYIVRKTNIIGSDEGNLLNIIKEPVNSTFETLKNVTHESRWNKIGNIVLYVLMVIVALFTIYGVIEIFNLN